MKYCLLWSFSKITVAKCSLKTPFQNNRKFPLKKIKYFEFPCLIGVFLVVFFLTTKSYAKLKLYPWNLRHLLFF